MTCGPKRRITAVSAILLSLFLLLVSLPKTAALDTDSPIGDMLFADSGRSTSAHVPAEPPTLRARQVVVDQELLARSEPGDAIGLNLFEDTVYQGIVDDVTENPSGSTSWIGHLRGEAFSQFVLVVGSGQMAGSITLPGATYEIRHLDGPTHAIRDADETLDALVEGPPIPMELLLEPAPSHVSGPADDGLTIDVMVVYTEAARDGAGGTTAMQNLIDLAVSETNQSYSNSGINQRIRLVNTAEVSYKETGNTHTELTRLQNPSDGFMDDVHTLRDLFGADAISLLLEIGDYGGRGYLLGGLSSFYERYAFNVRASPTGCRLLYIGPRVRTQHGGAP